MQTNNYPKIHNAAWPGVVGKGPGAEPAIGLETMLRLTSEANFDGQRFDGVDLFLAEPHISIDSTKDDILRLVELISSFDLEVGSVVAPVWGNTGGGSAMGTRDERKMFITQVQKACKIGRALRDLGIRPNGIVRIDSSVDPATWAKDPSVNTKRIAETFREACDIAADYDERLAAEGEICWGGMHGWKTMIETLENVDRPNIGFQADMAHTLMYLLGVNKEDERILPEDFEWEDRQTLVDSLKFLVHHLRPWTIDFHVAQNDGTVHGSGAHDKTGRHCQADDPNGKLSIIEDAGWWMRNDLGELTRSFKHICWDGCMFSNDVMHNSQTWTAVLTAMVRVRNKHGWYDKDD